MRRGFIVGGLMAVLVSTGCGPTFDADLMVSLEARWMCDVQRSVYEESADIEEAPAERLAGNSVTSEIYGDFKDALIDDLALRERVLDEYDLLV